MRKSLVLAAVAAASLAGVVIPGTAGATQTTNPHLHARYTFIPYQGGGTRGRATTSLPTFTHSVVSGGTSYTYREIGNDPFTVQSSPTTNVAVKVIPVKIVMKSFGSKAFDPSSATCSPGGAPTTLLMNSPLVKTRSYTVGGTAVGTDQYIGFDRRAEYFNEVKRGSINPNYHLHLSFTQTSGWVINVTGGAIFGSGCSSVADISINSFDKLVKNTIIPQTSGVTASTFPLILMTNVVMYDGTNVNNCCILGYHSAYNNQTYGVGEFDTNGQFSGVKDISALSHELAEWMDDPLVNNPTPPWGHIGQVSGCQNNLENGDPLSGTIHSISMNGYTYHPQELAFSSWFYPGTTNTGVNGWFSSNGKFRSAAAHCS